jgi:hypothetical protein
MTDGVYHFFHILYMFNCFIWIQDEEKKLYISRDKKIINNLSMMFFKKNKSRKAQFISKFLMHEINFMLHPKHQI